MNHLIPIRNRTPLHDWVFDFDKFFDTPTSAQRFDFRGDVEETDKEILMSFDLPGMKDDEFAVKVNKNILEISGERKSKKETNKNSKLIYSGRTYGRFLKKFTLPKNINAEKIEANYENGVLTIALPKKEEEVVTPIQIKIGRANK